MGLLIFTGSLFIVYLHKIEREAPKYINKSVQLIKLKRKLSKAIDNEFYELAAELRDQIYEIQKQTKKSLGSSNPLGIIDVQA